MALQPSLFQPSGWFSTMWSCCIQHSMLNYRQVLRPNLIYIIFQTSVFINTEAILVAKQFKGLNTFNTLDAIGRKTHQPESNSRPQQAKQPPRRTWSNGQETSLDESYLHSTIRPPPQTTLKIVLEATEFHLIAPVSGKTRNMHKNMHETRSDTLRLINRQTGSRTPSHTHPIVADGVCVSVCSLIYWLCVSCFTGRRSPSHSVVRRALSANPPLASDAKVRAAHASTQSRLQHNNSSSISQPAHQYTCTPF